ncbi:hypothetical protein BDS110ZK25_78290 [Bradyrhizobium diazoefficiens]
MQHNDARPREEARNGFQGPIRSRVRQSLEEGQPPGRARAFLRDVVREAPLPSLLVAFMRIASP